LFFPKSNNYFTEKAWHKETRIFAKRGVASEVENLTVSSAEPLTKEVI
jgi:hypothetical protein